jgi:hypothetical protein
VLCCGCLVPLVAGSAADAIGTDADYCETNLNT